MSSDVVVVSDPEASNFKEMNERPHMVATRGYVSEIPQELQIEILRYAAAHISPKTTMIAFKQPEKTDATEHYEDEGRTIIKPMKDVKETVYAILDDHETKENLSKWCGEQVNTQYLLTFLLAAEY